MEKNELASSLNEILVLIGVKKNGNYWGAVVMKLQKVKLQKSQFSNSYYVNYGYILKAVPLNGLTMHVFSGLTSVLS